MAIKKLVPTLDSFVWQPNVKSIENSPPASPSEGDRYLVGVGSGAWVGQDDNIAWYYDADWMFTLALEGMVLFNEETGGHLRHIDGSWVKSEDELIFKTTATLNLYVDETGNDTTGDGTVGNPYRQIDRALQDVPEIIIHAVNIFVGEGSYNSINIEKQGLAGFTAGRLTIKGSTTALTGEYANTVSGVEYLTVAGTPFTPDEHKGKFVEFTAGQGYSSSATASNLAPIIGNTDNTIRIPTVVTPYTTSTKFKIVEIGTNVLVNNRSSELLPVRLINISGSTSIINNCILNSGDLTVIGARVHSTAAARAIRSTKGKLVASNILGVGNIRMFRLANTCNSTVSGCVSLSNTSFIDIDGDGCRVEGRSLYVEGFTEYGVKATGNAVFQETTVGSTNPTKNYWNDGETVAIAETSGIVDMLVGESATPNTMNAKAATGGKVFTNSGILATTAYEVSEQESVIYNDDDGLELRANRLYQVIQLANDEYIDLPDAIKGQGSVIVGDNEEYARFRFSTTGSVALDENTVDISDTDTASKFCIFDNGTNVRVKNRLGSAYDIILTVNYAN